jgi:hypothetical protein
MIILSLFIKQGKFLENKFFLKKLILIKNKTFKFRFVENS